MKHTLTRFEMSKPSTGTWNATASRFVVTSTLVDRYVSVMYVARAVVSVDACGNARLRCMTMIFISNRMGTLLPATAFFVVTSATVRHRREKVSAGDRRPMAVASREVWQPRDTNEVKVRETGGVSGP